MKRPAAETAPFIHFTTHSGRRRAWAGLFRTRRPRRLDRWAAMAQTQAVSPYALSWLDPPAGPAVVLLDQTRLPAEETYLTCRAIPALDEAIRTLALRGAPLHRLPGAVRSA